MSVRSRIALLVQAQGARRAATDVDAVAKSTDRLGRKTTDAGKSMRRAKSDAASFRSSLRGVASAAKVGAVAAAGLGVAVAKGAVTEFREAYKVGKQTRAVIKATGGAANVTAKQVEDLAASISLKAGIDDEAIQGGANLLLTFKKIRNEVGAGNKIFDRATAAAVDLSAAGFGSIDSASKQLGKALNDPVKGMGALSRAGVTFDADAQKTIKSLVKQNRTLEAQKMILKEVEGQVKGSAAAQADPVSRATVAWGNLLETIGGKLEPTVASAADGFADFVEGIQNGTGAGGVFADVVGRVADGAKSAGRAAADAHDFLSRLVKDFKDGKPSAVALGVVVGGLVTGFVAFKVISGVVGAFKVLRLAVLGLNAAFLANPVVAVIAVVVGLGAALVIAYRKVGWFRDAVDTAWGALKSAWSWLSTNGPKILQYTPLGQLIKHFGTIKTVAWVAFRSFKNAAVTAFNIIKAPVQWLVDKVQWLLDKLPSLPKPGDLLPGGSSFDDIITNVAAQAGAPRTGGAPASPAPASEPSAGDAPGGIGNRSLATPELLPPVSLTGDDAGRAGLARMIGAELASRLNDQRVVLDSREAGTGVRRVALRDMLNGAPA